MTSLSHDAKMSWDSHWRKKKLYVRIDSALKTIVADYVNRECQQYLESIARINKINVL